MRAVLTRFRRAFARGLRRDDTPRKPPADPRLPDWRAIISSDRGLWNESRKRAQSGPRVLIGTAIGGHSQFTVVESALAVSLTLRGARTDIVLCDRALPACLRAKVSAVTPTAISAGELASSELCQNCIKTGRAVFAGTELEMLEIGHHLMADDSEEAERCARTVDLKQLKSFSIDGIPVGEHALAGALRYYGRGDLENEADGEGVLRRYVEASIRTLRASQRLLKKGRYDVALINHGIYAPHGILAAVARQEGVRVVTWNLAYRKQCAIFSHGDTYHHTLMNEPVSEWENMAWTEAHERAIVEYLDSRQKGSRDWIWFNANPDDDMERFAASVGLDWGRPVIAMLTNVVWDAQLHYPANAFPNMIEWAVKTVAYFQRRPELQLLIRVHPGELAPPGGQTKSNQPIVGEIQKVFPKLPPNVFVIPAESQVSTYSAAKRCDAVIIYGTKAGVEFTSIGLPVIAAGEAWIRNKGLTLDAKSEADYFRLLDQLPLRRRLDSGTIERARKYAYHFFFRRMVPLPFLTPVAKAWPPFVIAADGLREFLPGRHRGLDIVCDGLLKGAPFVFPAEVCGVHDQ